MQLSGGNLLRFQLEKLSKSLLVVSSMGPPVAAATGRPVTSSGRGSDVSSGHGVGGIIYFTLRPTNLALASGRWLTAPEAAPGARPARRGPGRAEAGAEEGDGGEEEEAEAEAAAGPRPAGRRAERGSREGRSAGLGSGRATGGASWAGRRRTTMAGRDGDAADEAALTGTEPPAANSSARRVAP